MGKGSKLVSLCWHCARAFAREDEHGGCGFHRRTAEGEPESYPFQAHVEKEHTDKTNKRHREPHRYRIIVVTKCRDYEFSPRAQQDVLDDLKFRQQQMRELNKERWREVANG